MGATDTAKREAAPTAGGRILAYDLMRCAACLMVVAMHAPMPSHAEHSPSLAALSYLTAPCIPIFFMISGALVLPVRTSVGAFLRRRMGRILWPLLVWSVLHMAVNQGIGGGNFYVALQSLLSVPFSVQGSAVLWFLYALAGLYLIAPLVSAGLERLSRRGLEFYLLLWVVTLLAPALEDAGLTVGQGAGAAFYHFQGYAGYFTLGYYLRRFGLPLPAVAVGVLCLLALCAPAACHVAGLRVDFYRHFWYLSLPVALMSVGWWAMLSEAGRAWRHSERLCQWCAALGNLSFGIYLVHIYVLRGFLWRQGWIAAIAPEALRTLALVVLGFLLSALLCYALSWLPGAQYVIGYRQKKK